MKTAIVGCTGFVGTNLCNSFEFDGKYNSRNIEEAYGTCPDCLVYSGVRAEMYLANQFPEKDWEIIQNAIENIKKIAPKKVILISTIAVYDQTYGVDEDSFIDESKSTVYGRNRRILEKWVEENFKEYLIVRLSGIYGANMKKNFIYDMIHIIPAMLNEKKYIELSTKDPHIIDYYKLQANGFYKCMAQKDTERKMLKQHFIDLDFTALKFTDGRGIFQYYNLNQLWRHIQVALQNNLQLLNLATEPVTPREIYEYVTGKEFLNEMTNPLPHFDFKSKYADLMGGKNGYILTKEQALIDIKKFIEDNSL
ncbi:MAG: hypothetical protein H6Q13_2650 [Bacteroidetes bacterium]|nr:hypothetical protein [Bacteroidota bacterium]